MFSHMVVGSNDLSRSKNFYDALFEKEGRQDDKGRLSYGRKGTVFMVTDPIDGEAATHGNGFWNSGALDSNSKSPLPANASLKFDTAGTYTFYCLIHPFMRGTVTVQ